MSPLVVLEQCPECRSRLVLRVNRRDGGSFVGCSTWPRCTFVEAFDEREQRLAERIAALEDALAAVPSPIPDVVAKELRALAAKFHPDRHHGARWAHDVCAALLELRERVSRR